LGIVTGGSFTGWMPSLSLNQQLQDAEGSTRLKGSLSHYHSTQPSIPHPSWRGKSSTGLWLYGRVCSFMLGGNCVIPCSKCESSFTKSSTLLNLFSEREWNC